MASGDSGLGGVDGCMADAGICSGSRTGSCESWEKLYDPKSYALRAHSFSISSEGEQSTSRHAVPLLLTRGEVSDFDRSRGEGRHSSAASTSRGVSRRQR